VSTTAIVIDEMGCARRYVHPLDARAAITLEGRRVLVAAWVDEVEGVTGYRVPVFLLDTDLPENPDGNRAIHAPSVRRRPRYRLLQEAALGIGGVARLVTTLLGRM